MPIIEAVVRRCQVDYEFEVSIKCMARLWALLLLLWFF